MKRRALLAAAAGLLPTVAGCVSSGGGGAPSTESPSTTTAPSTTDDASSPTDTPCPSSTPSLVDHSFERREECADPGGATVVFGSCDVAVTGCIRGPDGCSVPALGDVRYDADADVLTVLVTVEREADEDTVCTQAIVDLGYAVTATFEGGLPGTVEVVHEGAYGRAEAARATRD
jgi:hypothetical protein